jgi:uncharacterized membrane protein HdeD (DUF308 family)
MPRDFAQALPRKLSVMAGPEYTAEDAAYWYAPLVRAVPAAVLACVITFAGGFYTPEYGLASFGGYALVAGLLGLFLSLRAMRRGGSRGMFVIQSIVSIGAGVAALIGVHGGLPVLLVVVALWGVVAGFLELIAGIRQRKCRVSSRDWMFVGGLTVLLGVVALVIPPNYSQPYDAPDDGGSRVITTSVDIVGAIGVYAAIVAVYLAIAAFSLRWGAAAALKTAATADAATKAQITKAQITKAQTPKDGTGTDRAPKQTARRDTARNDTTPKDRVRKDGAAK